MFRRRGTRICLARRTLRKELGVADKGTPGKDKKRNRYGTDICRSRKDRPRDAEEPPQQREKRNSGLSGHSYSNVGKLGRSGTVFIRCPISAIARERRNAPSFQ